MADQKRTPTTYENMSQNNRSTVLNVLSHWLSEATGGRMQSEQAMALIRNQIKGEYVFGPASTNNLLNEIAVNNNINLSTDYLNQLNDQKEFVKRFRNYNAEIQSAHIGDDAYLPKEITNAIRPYVKTARQREIETKFRYIPARNNDEYAMSVARMNQMITYLNDNRIAFTLAVDARNTSKIVASLEEYDNMLVDVYSSDPRDIGRVNTFKNIYSVDTHPDGVTYDDPNAALAHRAYQVLDTVLNPNANVENVRLIKPTANSGRAVMAKMYRESSDLNIFVSNIKDAQTPIRKRIEQMESLISADETLLAIDDVNESTTLNEKTQEEIDTFNSLQNSDESDSDDNAGNKPKKLDMLKSRLNSDMHPADPDDPVAKQIQMNMLRLGVVPAEINVNDEGVYQYKYINPSENTQEMLDNGMPNIDTAYIGGIRELAEDGTYDLKHEGKTYATFVPGLRAYIDSQTGELRVKTFDEIFNERLHQIMTDQVLNPSSRESVEAYTAFDTLYSAGAYGVSIQKGVNPPEIEDVLIKSLKKRLRLPTEVIDSATTGNDENLKPNAVFKNKVDEFMRTKSIRVVPKEFYPVVDPLVTSIGKNQGGVLYLGAETTIDKHGRLIPGEGITHAVSDVRQLPFFEEANQHDPVDRIIMSSTQLLRNVPVVDANIALMEFGGHDVNDPFIVSKSYAEKVHVHGHDGANRPLKIGDKITDFHGNKGLVTMVVDPDDTDVQWATNLEAIEWGVPVDGLTQDQYNYLREINPNLPETLAFDKDIDATDLSAEDVARLTSELNDAKSMLSTMRVSPDQVDLDRIKLRVTNPDVLEFEAQDYASIKTVAEAGELSPLEKAYFNSSQFYDKNYIREREVFKQNPDLEVVVAPFSLLSRANMGLPVEMRNNNKGYLNDVALPDGTTIDLGKVSMGNISMMVSDMDVDYKTSIYDKESYEKGKGRKLSHQLIMGMQALGLNKTLEHVFQDKQMNAEGWGQAIDDMRMMGFDIDKEGRIGRMDMSNVYKKLDANDPSIAIIQPDNYISFKDQLEHATKVKGAKDIYLHLPTTVTLRSDIQTQLLRVPTAQFEAASNLEKYAAETGTAGSHGSFFMNQFERIYSAACDKDAIHKVPAAVATLDSAIAAREFSKDKNVFKTKVFNARLPKSATAPMTNRPTGDIGTIYVSPEIHKTLEVDEKVGDYAMVWRDPILDTGGFVAMKVEVDEELTGCAIHYANDEAMKADRDGDSLAIWYCDDPKVQQEWEEKASREWRLDDPFRNKDDYQTGLTQGLNLDAGLAKLGLEGEALKAEFNSPTITKDRAQAIYNVATRTNDGIGSYGLDVTTDESINAGLNKIIESGAKGKPSSLYMTNKFLHGNERTQEEIDNDNRDWEYALGAKVDFVGLAGSIQQQLVKYMRNGDINAAMLVSALPTQGALQAKHDPEQARQIGHLLRQDLPNVMSGYDRYQERSSKNKTRITNAKFKNQVDQILNKEMGVHVGSEIIESLADSMTGEDGYIKTPEELSHGADGIDLVAYGGIGDFKEAARQNMVFGGGKNSYMFKPPVELTSDTVLDRYTHQQLPNRSYAKTKEELRCERGDLRVYRQQVRAEKEAAKRQTQPQQQPTFNPYAASLQKRAATMEHTADVTPDQRSYEAPRQDVSQLGYVDAPAQPELEELITADIDMDMM